MIDPKIHVAAAEGYSLQADTYQSARPSYHPDLVARFVEQFSDGTVLDLGAGTGKFTGLLHAADVDVIAVEPIAATRSLISERLPGVPVVDGSAESIPLPNASVVTVVVAQAFHWFRHAAALDEIIRLLRPGGALVTVWNVRDETVPWVAAYSEIVNRHAGDTPRHRTMEWRQAIEADDRFELVDDWTVDHPVDTSAKGVLARALSTSFIAALPAEEQHRVRRELEAVTAPLGERFHYPYRAELQAWRRRPSMSPGRP